MVTIPELRMNFKSNLKLNVNGGNLTSDCDDADDLKSSTKII